MLSGGAAGLVSVDILRKEQEEIRRKEKRNQPLEGLMKSHCVILFSIIHYIHYVFLLSQRHPEMRRRYFETSQVGDVTWSRKESSLAKKLEKRQRRMKNMHNGEKGKVHLVVFNCNYFFALAALTSVLSFFRLAQGEMQQQNLTDAMREAQKPLARHIDDEDLDRMLREQERDGDPMAAMLRKKKDKNAKLKGSNGKTEE